MKKKKNEKEGGRRRKKKKEEEEGRRRRRRKEKNHTLSLAGLDDAEHFVFGDRAHLWQRHIPLSCLFLPIKLEK